MRHIRYSLVVVLLLFISSVSLRADTFYSIRERSDAKATITFVDENGYPDAPSSASYTVRNNRTGVILLGPITVPSPGSTLTFKIPGALVHIREKKDSASKPMYRTLSVAWLSQGGYAGGKEWVYQVPTFSYPLPTP